MVKRNSSLINNSNDIDIGNNKKLGCVDTNVITTTTTTTTTSPTSISPSSSSTSSPIHSP